MGIKLIDKINAEQTAKLSEKKFPEFRTGDIVRVSIKIKEGEKFRIQDFEGKVLAIDNGRSNVAGNFTVSRDAFGDQGRQEGQRMAREALHGAHLLLAQGCPQAGEEIIPAHRAASSVNETGRPQCGGGPFFGIISHA